LLQVVEGVVVVGVVVVVAVEEDVLYW